MICFHEKIPEYTGVKQASEALGVQMHLEPQSKPEAVQEVEREVGQPG